MSACSSSSIRFAAAQQIGQRGAADDVAQRRLRRPAHRLRIVLHFERGLLRVVHHPEEHGVDVHRHGIGGQRLLGGEAGRDRALIDPGRHAIHERHDPEQARAAQADEPPEPQHHRALPLLRDARRRHQHDTDERHDDQRKQVAGGVRSGEAEHSAQSGMAMATTLIAVRASVGSSERPTGTETMEDSSVSGSGRSVTSSAPFHADDGTLPERLDHIVEGEPGGVGVGEQPVMKARRRRSCSRGGWARAAVPQTNEPTPRRVSITPARSSSAYTRATVLALTLRSTASCRTVGSWSPGLQTARRHRRPESPLELRVDRRAVPGVDRNDGHRPLTHLY